MKHEWSLPCAIAMAYSALKRERDEGNQFHNTKENMEGALKRLEYELTKKRRSSKRESKENRDIGPRHC